MRLSFRTVTLGLLLAIAASGCNCEGPNCAVVPAQIVDAGIQTEGSHVHIEFVQQMPESCEEQTQVSGVAPEISDESNHDVPAEGSFVQTRGQLAVPVTVDFDARDPGWYHAAVHVEPGISTVQFPILVTRDRSDAGVITLNRPCGAPEVTSKGTVICDGQPVHLGSSQSEFNADALTVVGDVVWTWTGNTVQRWEDQGASLAQTPAASVTVDDGPGTLVASDDGGEVFTLGQANVNRIAVRNGALATLSTTPLGRAISYRFGIATADTLYAIQADQLTGTGSILTVCTYSLAGDIVTFTNACQQIQGRAEGMGDGAFWTRDDASIRAWIPGDGKLRTAGTALLPALQTFSPYVVVGDTPTPVAAVSPFLWLAPRLVDGRVIYDRYRTVSGFTFYSASPTAFAERADNTSRVYLR
ncbi:MAG: hypothetical protein ACJ790_17380 [Myxococcaceae bacterium]